MAKYRVDVTLEGYIEIEDVSIQEQAVHKEPLTCPECKVKGRYKEFKNAAGLFGHRRLVHGIPVRELKEVM
jgi:hypothetical protein